MEHIKLPNIRQHRLVGAPEQSIPLVVEGRYLLAMHIPFILGDDNTRSVDELWHRDLAAHVKYIPHLVLAAPSIHGRLPQGHVHLESGELNRGLRFVDLPATRSTLEALLNLPRTAWAMAREIRRSDIVHAHVTGWPIPTAWIAAPLAWWYRKFLVIVVESSPWPPAELPHPRLRDRIRGVLFERMAKFIVNRAALIIFTHEGYRRRFLTRHQNRGHVINASWIDSSVILDDSQAEAAIRARARRPRGSLCLLFASRIVKEKGVMVLLEAMRMIAEQNLSVELDVIGEGELQDVCRREAMKRDWSIRISVQPPLPYGRAFFEKLRAYDAVIVPSISEEQPRIVYDAFSQAVPVFASDTEGLKTVVKDGLTGKLFRVNDPRALSSTIAWAVEHRDEINEMGRNGLPVARGLTHEAMHSKRCLLLRKAMAEAGLTVSKHVAMPGDR